MKDITDIKPDELAFISVGSAVPDGFGVVTGTCGENASPYGVEA